MPFQLLKQLHTRWAPKSDIFIAKVYDWVLKSVMVCAITALLTSSVLDAKVCNTITLWTPKSVWAPESVVPGGKVCCLLPFSPPQCLWIYSFTNRPHIGHQSLSPVVTTAQYQSQMSLT